MEPPEFDRFSASYDDLLKDPIRDRFAGPDALFFHVRKRDLIREFFRRRGVDTARLHYLDVGCGKGELLGLLRGAFGRAAGCDVSPHMLESIPDLETRVQPDPARVPFSDGEFDFVTAVCVYHHIEPAARPALTREIFRLLKPGGVFCVMEHNPWNPVTRLIVGRTPVDAGAILLGAAEARGLVKAAGFAILERQYFLYFPSKLYARLRGLERALRAVPLGGQYAVFARKPGA